MNDKIKERLKEVVMATIEEIENLPTIEDDEGKYNNFFNDILSVTYISHFDNQKQIYQGAELLVAFGGPNVYIDTRYNLVVGHWGSSSIEMSYNDDNFLYEYFEEFFYCSM